MDNYTKSHTVALFCSLVVAVCAAFANTIIMAFFATLHVFWFAANSYLIWAGRPSAYEALAQINSRVLDFPHVWLVMLCKLGEVLIYGLINYQPTLVFLNVVGFFYYAAASIGSYKHSKLIEDDPKDDETPPK